MRRTSILAATVLAAAALAACKGDAKTTSFVFSPDAGATAGYVGGVPVTLVDGTPVTLPNGTPVTTPQLKDKDGNPITTVKGTDVVTTPTTRSTTGGTGGTGFVQPTGTTAVTSKPNTYKLAFPKQGVYGFHETNTPDDGGIPKQRDFFYKVASPDQNVRIRWQEADASGQTNTGFYYEESHLADGLWLVGSSIDTEDNRCNWSPKSAELPQVIVDKIGEKVTTDSSCTAKANGKDTEFNLHTEVKSLRLEELLIGGKKYTCIVVERNRVLTAGSTRQTSTAHDWYAFELGIRVKASDHLTQTTDTGTSGGTRDLVISSLA